MPAHGGRVKAPASLAAVVAILTASSRRDRVGRIFYRPVYRLLTHHIKPSSFCPDTYEIHRIAFILVPGDKSILSLQHIKAKSFVLGVFVPRI